MRDSDVILDAEIVLKLKIMKQRPMKSGMT